MELPVQQKEHGPSLASHQQILAIVFDVVPDESLFPCGAPLTNSNYWFYLAYLPFKPPASVYPHTIHNMIVPNIYNGSEVTHLVSGGPITACACDGTSVINGTILLSTKMYFSCAFWAFAQTFACWLPPLCVYILYVHVVTMTVPIHLHPM